MEVPDGFWEDLQSRLAEAEKPAAASKHAYMGLSRKWVAAAASIAVILGLASVTHWLLNPSVTRRDFMQGRNWSDGSLMSDRVVADEPLPEAAYLPDLASRIPQASPQLSNTLMQGDASQVDNDYDDEEEMVHVTLQITEQVYGTARRGGNGNGYVQAGNVQEAVGNTVDEEQATTQAAEARRHVGAWKLMAGSALPQGGDYTPLTVGATVERSLGSRVSLEAGLLFNHYIGDGVDDANSISVPVKANVLLANSSKAELYATVGGAAEKTLEHNFSDEPVRLSVMGGVGVRYKMNDNLALFAEPTVSHHFSNDGVVSDLHGTTRVQLGLMCGLRMSY